MAGECAGTQQQQRDYPAAAWGAPEVGAQGMVGPFSSCVQHSVPAHELFSVFVSFFSLTASTHPTRATCLRNLKAFDVRLMPPFPWF